MMVGDEGQVEVRLESFVVVVNFVGCILNQWGDN